MTNTGRLMLIQPRVSQMRRLPRLGRTLRRPSKDRSGFACQCFAVEPSPARRVCGVAADQVHSRLQIFVLLRRPGEDEASPLALKDEASPLALKLQERAGLRQSRAGQLSERARRAAMKRAQFLSSSASAEDVARIVVGGGVEHENGSVSEAADAPLSASLQMDHGNWEISAELFAFATPPLPSLSPLPSPLSLAAQIVLEGLGRAGGVMGGMYAALRPRSASSRRVQGGEMPTPDTIVASVAEDAAGLDLVGILAAGPVWRGLASSFGQRSWHAVSRFDAKVAAYLGGDRAVQTTLAGAGWSRAAWRATLADARARLDALGRPARPIPPGRYRALLLPHAVEELLGMMNWGGFSAAARRTVSRRAPGRAAR